MKVDDTVPPAAQTAKTSEGGRPSSASFSGVLARKLEDSGSKTEQDGRFAQPDEALLALPMTMPADQIQPEMVFQPSSEMRSDTTKIQALIQEILVVAQPNGRQAVEIQFDSKTLDGLNVQISQQQGQVAIRFSAASAPVSELISRNLDQLSDALQRKGLNLAPIQVELTSMPNNSGTNNPGSSNTGARDGRRGEQNQDRRQQQQRKR